MDYEEMSLDSISDVGGHQEYGKQKAGDVDVRSKIFWVIRMTVDGVGVEA